MFFATPAPLTFPNTAGWTPGTVMDLRSINPMTGKLEIAGEMVVSNDGERIESTSGGLSNIGWHFPAPRPESLTLHYHSQRADPRPIVHFGINHPQSGDDCRIVARLTFLEYDRAHLVPGAAAGAGLPGDEHFWRVPAGAAGLRMAIQGDLRNLPTGIYDYQALFPAELTRSPQLAPPATPRNAEATDAGPSGAVTATVLDQAGQRVSSRDSMGNIGRVSRNGDNLISVTTDARGFQTRYSYDGFGNISQVTDSLILNDLFVEHYMYDRGAIL